MTGHKRFFGKYRGVVTNVADPLGQGRIQARVPDASDLASASWAMPCFPVSGMFMLPAVGSNVWIEFERGDADFPIWAGCFYANAADVPAAVTTAPVGATVFTMQTPLGNAITVTDGSGPNGGIMINSPSGASVIVNDIGIHVANGKGASITLAGPTVTINDDALMVV